MPDLPTRLDYFRIGADDVLQRSEARPPGRRISPSEVFTNGSDINIVIASASAMAEEVSRQLGIRVQALLLDGARGADLDRLVADRYATSLVRKTATPALGTLSISRTAGAFPAITLPTGTLVSTDGGIDFKTTADVSLGVGDPGPSTVAAEAVVTGLSGNVAKLTITQFNQPPADPALQVTNLDVFAGGAPTETDASLRERARAFFTAARRGTLAAIEFGALTVPGVAQATAYESTDAQGQPTGDVQCFITDPQGNANQALVDAVVNALVEYRAAGIWVQVIPTQPEPTEIQYNLQFIAGFDTTVVFSQVQQAVLSFVNGLPPGTGDPDGPGVLRESDLLAIARSIPGTIVNAGAVLVPTGDVVPPAGKTIRTTLALITNT